MCWTQPTDLLSSEWSPIRQCEPSRSCSFQAWVCCTPRALCCKQDTNEGSHLVGVADHHAAHGRATQLLCSQQVALRVWAASRHVLCRHDHLEGILQAGLLQAQLQARLRLRCCQSQGDLCMQDVNTIQNTLSLCLACTACRAARLDGAQAYSSASGRPCLGWGFESKRS